MPPCCLKKKDIPPSPGILMLRCHATAVPPLDVLMAKTFTVVFTVGNVDAATDNDKDTGHAAAIANATATANTAHDNLFAGEKGSKGIKKGMVSNRKGAALIKKGAAPVNKKVDVDDDDVVVEDNNDNNAKDDKNEDDDNKEDCDGIMGIKKEPHSSKKGAMPVNKKGNVDDDVVIDLNE